MQNFGSHNEILKKIIKSKDVKSICDRMIPIKTDGCWLV